MVLLFYTTYISVDLAHHKIVRAKVGKGGIILISKVINDSLLQNCFISVTLSPASSMYIRGLIPRNFAELVEAVPVAQRALLQFKVGEFTPRNLGVKGLSKVICKAEIFCFIIVCYISLLGLVARKPVFGVSDKASFKLVSSATETS